MKAKLWWLHDQSLGLQFRGTEWHIFQKVSFFPSKFQLMGLEPGFVDSYTWMIEMVGAHMSNEIFPIQFPIVCIEHSEWM